MIGELELPDPIRCEPAERLFRMHRLPRSAELPQQVRQGAVRFGIGQPVDTIRLQAPQGIEQ